MIHIEPTAFRLTIGDHTHDLTTEEAQDLCASLMAVLPSAHDDHDCGCSEEVPAVTPADFHDTSPPTLRGFSGEAIALADAPVSA